jgi:hypothetical protein
VVISAVTVNDFFFAVTFLVQFYQEILVNVGPGEARLTVTAIHEDKEARSLLDCNQMSCSH